MLIPIAGGTAGLILLIINRFFDVTAVELSYGMVHYDSNAVRKAALVAAGQLKSPKLWPMVIENLNNPSVRPTAATALIECRNVVLPALEQAFNQTQNRNMMLRVVRICGLIGGEQAVAFLRKQLNYPDEEINHQILIALHSCGYFASKEDKALILEMVDAEVDDAAWAIASQLDLQEFEETAAVIRALQTEFEENRERIFLLLSFIFSSDAIQQSWMNIASDSPEKQDYALEIIENLLPYSLKKIILPLIEPIFPFQSLRKLSDQFAQPTLECNDRLTNIITRKNTYTNAWTKSCAIHAIGTLKASDLTGIVINALSDDEPLVRELAVWALGQLKPSRLSALVSPLIEDQSPQVSKMAQFVSQFENTKRNV